MRPRRRSLRSTLAGTVFCAVGLVSCSPPGETYVIRYELWSNWEAVDSPPGGCNGFDADSREIALIDTDGTVVSSFVAGTGYLDSSLRNTFKRPDRVCVYDLEFVNVRSIDRYRILWPRGSVSSSFTEEDLATYDRLPWVFEGSWRPQQ
jgi:hypothetical protein